jgi:hypothetical protein
LKGIAIHYGLCKKGRTKRDERDIEPPQAPEKEAKMFACEECSISFTSAIRLGQHVRHKHPDLANKKKIASAKVEEERKRKARGSSKAMTSNNTITSSNYRKMWSDENVVKLL